MAISISDPFQIFYLNNNDPDIMNLEFGLLPSPERSRSPSGMVKLSMSYVIAQTAPMLK
jgi:hypothetical protein